jgi:hypothetical protein
MRCLGILCWLMMAVLSPQDKAMDQHLTVLVLDALDGKPQAGVKVHYFCIGKFRHSPEKSIWTNQEGKADVPFSCGDDDRIEVWTSSPKKEQCGDLPPVTYSAIASVGIVSKPDADGGLLCSTKVSRKLKPVPGQVIIFVKKPTWWQSHFAG